MHGADRAVEERPAAGHPPRRIVRQLDMRPVAPARESSYGSAEEVVGEMGQVEGILGQVGNEMAVGIGIGIDNNVRQTKQVLVDWPSYSLQDWRLQPSCEGRACPSHVFHG
jgi:hypothetical protein